MNRRDFLKGSAAATTALAAPGLGNAQGPRVIRFVPEADVAVLDPVVTPAAQTREHAYLVYDTLFGLDDAFQPHPQMVEGFNVEEDGRRWGLTLRPGLKFHDGERVLARDAVASIKRWGVRDAFGQTLMAATDDLSAVDDRTFVFRLRRPFPLLPNALGKTMAMMCPVMPERLASSDPFRPITDPVGSGPYRYKTDERIPGARIVYERFADYVPREGGTPQTTAGPKVAHFDRVEWAIMPDGATAAAALQRAEIDWLQTPDADLLPVMRRARGITTRVISSTGLVAYMRLNHLLPPFDNPGVRRALIGAVDQAQFMSAINGGDPELWRDKVGYFCPGTPLANEAGMELLTGPRDLEKVKRDLAAAGYAGERVVLMVAVDVPYLRIMGDLTADLLRKVGMAFDYQGMDWTTFSQRRFKTDPVSAGGWNLYCINDNGVNQLNPATHLFLRGNGRAAQPGWPTSPGLEALRDEWLGTADPAAQRRLAERIQIQAFEDVPYIPLGQSIAPTAFRSNLTGVLNGQPTFWNVRRA